MQLPKRNSMAHETASVLKEWIASGMFQEVLPGELALKTRLHVGRDTLRLALQLLTNEGWVEPSTMGKKRRICAPRCPPIENPDKGLPVSFLSSYSEDQQRGMVDLKYIEESLKSQGRSLQIVSENALPKDWERHLAKLVQSHPSAAWILYAATNPTQQWFARQGLPTLICGSPYPGVELPYVGIDWEPAGFHVALQLIRQGHRKIGLFGYVHRGAGALAIEKGMRRAIETMDKGVELLVFDDERTPQSIVKSYEAAFGLKDRPTAILLTSSDHLLTSLSWMVSKGISVPADISLVVMSYEIWYEQLLPKVCHYKPNKKIIGQGIANRAMELIEHGRVIHKSYKVPVDFVAGTTIGVVPMLH